MPSRHSASFWVAPATPGRQLPPLLQPKLPACPRPAREGVIPARPWLGGKPAQPGWPQRTSTAPGWAPHAEQNRHIHPMHDRGQKLWLPKAKSKGAAPQTMLLQKAPRPERERLFLWEENDLFSLLKKPCQALEPPGKEAGLLQLAGFRNGGGGERAPCSLLCFMQASKHGYRSKTGD